MNRTRSRVDSSDLPALIERAIKGDEEALELIRKRMQRSARYARMAAEEAIRQARTEWQARQTVAVTEAKLGQVRMRTPISIVYPEQLRAACKSGAEWAWLETPFGRQVPALLLCPSTSAQLERWKQAPDGLPPVKIQLQVWEGRKYKDGWPAVVSKLLRFLILVKDGEEAGWGRDTFFDVRNQLFRTEAALKHILDSGELLTALVVDRGKSIVPLTILRFQSGQNESRMASRPSKTPRSGTGKKRAETKTESRESTAQEVQTTRKWWHVLFGISTSDPPQAAGDTKQPEADLDHDGVSGMRSQRFDLDADSQHVIVSLRGSSSELNKLVVSYVREQFGMNFVDQRGWFLEEYRGAWVECLAWKTVVDEPPLSRKPIPVELLVSCN